MVHGLLPVVARLEHEPVVLVLPDQLVAYEVQQTLQFNEVVHVDGEHMVVIDLVLLAVELVLKVKPDHVVLDLLDQQTVQDQILIVKAVQHEALLVVGLVGQVVALLHDFIHLVRVTHIELDHVLLDLLDQRTVVGAVL